MKKDKQIIKEILSKSIELLSVFERDIDGVNNEEQAQCIGCISDALCGIRLSFRQKRPLPDLEYSLGKLNEYKIIIHN